MHFIHVYSTYVCVCLCSPIHVLEICGQILIRMRYTHTHTRTLCFQALRHSIKKGLPGFFERVSVKPQGSSYLQEAMIFPWKTVEGKVCVDVRRVSF